MLVRVLPLLSISLLLLSLPLLAEGSNIISLFLPVKTVTSFPITSSSQITTISSALSQFLSQSPIVAKFLGSPFNPKAVGTANGIVILPSSPGQRSSVTTPAPSGSVNSK